VILTKDTDFFDKLILRGSPPKIVWLRTGNMRRADLLIFLSKIWPQVMLLLKNADLIEIHPQRIEAIRL